MELRMQNATHEARVNDLQKSLGTAVEKLESITAKNNALTHEVSAFTSEVERLNAHILKT